MKYNSGCSNTFRYFDFTVSFFKDIRHFWEFATFLDCAITLSETCHNSIRKTRGKLAIRDREEHHRSARFHHSTAPWSPITVHITVSVKKKQKKQQNCHVKLTTSQEICVHSHRGIIVLGVKVIKTYICTCHWRVHNQETFIIILISPFMPKVLLWVEECQADI